MTNASPLLARQCPTCGTWIGRGGPHDPCWATLHPLGEPSDTYCAQCRCTAEHDQCCHFSRCPRCGERCQLVGARNANGHVVAGTQHYRHWDGMVSGFGEHSHDGRLA
jgi:hypothetical protein